MGRQRKQSTTTYPIPILLVSSTDHVTAVTGATVTATISKNGAAFGAAAGAVTEIGNGWYALAGNATDRDTLGPLLIHATATGADPFDTACEIVSYDPFASVDANVTSIAGQAASAAAGVTFPGTIASTTNITAGTITTVTNLTNLPSIPANWITAAGVAADAIGASELATDAVTEIVDAVWNRLLTAITTTGSIGKLIKDYLDAQVSTVGGGDAASIADAVWDEALSGHATAGSAGAALTGAGSAGNPWTDATLSSYGAGTAGEALRLIRQRLIGKSTLDLSTGVMIVKAEDGTTTLKTLTPTVASNVRTVTPT